MDEQTYSGSHRTVEGLGKFWNIEHRTLNPETIGRMRIGANALNLETSEIVEAPRMLKAFYQLGWLDILRPDAGKRDEE